MQRFERMRKRQRYRRRLLDADPHCWFCGTDLTKRRPTLDHIIPRSEGGTDHYRNFRLACCRCNCRRGTRAGEELICDYRRGGGVVKETVQRLLRSGATY